MSKTVGSSPTASTKQLERAKKFAAPSKIRRSKISDFQRE
jgi:hypothetical protein